MKKVQIEFKAPVYADQVFQIESTLAALHEKAGMVECHMTSKAGTVAHAECQFELVCVSKQENQPCKWPSDFISLFFES